MVINHLKGELRDHLRNRRPQLPTSVFGVSLILFQPTAGLSSEPSAINITEVAQGVPSNLYATTYFWETSWTTRKELTWLRMRGEDIDAGMALIVLSRSRMLPE